MKKLVFISIMVVICMAVPAMGYPVTGSLYDADEIVYLPVPPNPAYTNYASGTIDASDPLIYNDLNGYASHLDHTILVENELDFTKWKEFLMDLKFTFVAPNPWIELHIDFSMTNPAWLDDPVNNPQFLCEAYWGYGPVTAPLPGSTWRAIGFPGSNPNAPQSPLLQSLMGTENDLINLGLGSNHPLGLPFYDWNPEWVSLSFHGYGFTVDYEFTDWCIPEPTTVLLLGLGGLLLRRRRA